MTIGESVSHTILAIAQIAFVLSNLLGLIPLTKLEHTTNMPNVLQKEYATEHQVNANAFQAMKGKVVKGPRALTIVQGMDNVHILRILNLQLFLLTMLLVITFPKTPHLSRTMGGTTRRLEDVFAILNMLMSTALSACVLTGLMSWMSD